MRRMIDPLLPRARDERGASAVLLAMLIVPMMAFGAIALDIGAQHAERTQLQQGADAAALAVALACGEDASTCAGASQAIGDDFVASNAGIPVDGAATIEEIDFTNNRVTVSADADFPHFFASLIDGDADPSSTYVRARATAEWVNGTRATVVPFAVGECAVPTSGGGTSVYIPIENKTCSGSVPGGFGWLDDGTQSCIKDVSLLDFTTITTGNTGKCTLSNDDLIAAADQIGCSLSSVPNKYKTNIEKLFYCFIGRTLLVPVFNLASECPTTPPPGKAYCITKFAAFEVEGVHVKVNGNEQIDDCKPAVSCSLPNNWGELGFQGRFIQYVTIEDDWTLGPPKPKIKLIG